MTNNQTLAQTVVRAIRELAVSPNDEHPETITVVAGDLEAIIDDKLEEWLLTVYDPVPSSQSDKPSPGIRTTTGETARGESCDLPPPSSHERPHDHGYAQDNFHDYDAKGVRLDATPSPQTHVIVPSIDRDRAAKAAAEANAAYGQWMPERWLHLFLDAYEGKSR